MLRRYSVLPPKCFALVSCFNGEGVFDPSARWTLGPEDNAQMLSAVLKNILLSVPELLSAIDMVNADRSPVE